jgi:fatty-acyl-CoA synthase
MTAAEFRLEVTSKLLANRDRILLRIGLQPDLLQPLEYNGEQLLNQATALAKGYLAYSGPGDVVLILLPHSPELFLLHLGLLIEGRVPAILPWPTSRMDAEKYQRNLLHQLRSLPAKLLITLPRLVDNLSALPFPLLPCACAGHKDFSQSFQPLPEGAIETIAGSSAHPSQSLHDALFLQFSGGTTGPQKSVVVTPQMMVAQMARLREALSFGGTDAVASWLPLYHDMGLIACLWFPLWHERPSTHISATDWLMRPEMIFAYLESFGATFCWLPNFAFSYLAAQKASMQRSYNLSHVRAFVNCSEPVRRQSIDAFQDCFSAWGVTPGMLQASYAMAENVFAITQSTLGQPLRNTPRTAVTSDANTSLSFGLLDRTYVSSGKPLTGMQIKIVDSLGATCEDGVPGEIWIQTESQFSGYWGSAGYQTASVVDGWHRTGDFGFLKDNELFVIGRLKDIVIVGGQNIFPEDVESVVNAIPGVYPGRAVAFGVLSEESGTEALAVVAEIKGDFDATGETAVRQLQREIQKTVLASIGVAPRYVKVAPERWIVKSTAGKISRRDTKTRFVEELQNDRNS